MKIVEITTYFNAPADRIWEEVNKPGLLLFVARPLVHFEPLEPRTLPDRWREEEYVFRMWLFGILPLGRQTVGISRPAENGNLRELQDNGHSALIKRWVHLISVNADGDGTRYTDRIELDAGFASPVLAAFARVFFAHRHRRWQKLVKSGFDYAQP